MQDAAMITTDAPSGKSLPLMRTGMFVAYGRQIFDAPSGGAQASRRC
jgi:hypothetical protein